MARGGRTHCSLSRPFDSPQFDILPPTLQAPGLHRRRDSFCSFGFTCLPFDISRKPCNHIITMADEQAPDANFIQPDEVSPRLFARLFWRVETDRVPRSDGTTRALTTRWVGLPCRDRWFCSTKGWIQGAEVASSGSSLTSVTSSILRGKVEDGRVYAVYGKEGMFYISGG